MGRNTENPVLTITRTASGTITTRRFVKNSGAQCSVHGERAIGVAADGADDGKIFPVIVEGIALVESSRALAVDDLVTPDANGKATVATKATFIAGIVMAAVTGAGQLVPVFLGSIKQELVRTTTTTTTSSTTSTSSTTTTTTAA